MTGFLARQMTVIISYAGPDKAEKLLLTSDTGIRCDVSASLPFDPHMYSLSKWTYEYTQVWRRMTVSQRLKNFLKVGLSTSSFVWEGESFTR